MPSKQNITVNLGTDELVISRYGVSGPGWHLPLDKAEKVFGAALHAVEVLIALQVSGPFDHETPPPSRSAQNAGGIETADPLGSRATNTATTLGIGSATLSPASRGSRAANTAPPSSCKCAVCRCSSPDDDSPVGVPV